MGIVIPEVLNHYNVYNDKAKKLIGISGEIELGELEALTDTLEGAGVLGEIEDAVTGRILCKMLSLANCRVCIPCPARIRQ